MNIQMNLKENQDNWSTILKILPIGWESKSKELEALKRERNFTSEKLLKTLLIHLLDNCSLKETSVRAKMGGLVDVSAVSLLKRLSKSGEWFSWMSRELMREVFSCELKSGENKVNIVDATHVKEFGETGSNWRIHYVMSLEDMSCKEVKVTEESIGESFKNYEIERGSIYIGDRGYYSGPGIKHIMTNGGEVIVRMSITRNKIYKDMGCKEKFDIIEELKILEVGKIGDWEVYINSEDGIIKGRVCAIKKSVIEYEKGMKKILKNAKKKGRQVSERVLDSSKYIYIFTTINSMKLSATEVLELYRMRWQVELTFKRLKSLLRVSYLPKQNPISAKSWIEGKLFCAFLIETLVRYGESFFPWGYPIQRRVK